MITVTAIALPARTIPPAVVCDMIIDSGFNVSLNIVSLSAIAHALQRAKVKSDTIPSFAIGTTIFQELLNAPGAVNFSGFNQHIRYIPPLFFITVLPLSRVGVQRFQCFCGRLSFTFLLEQKQVLKPLLNLDSIFNAIISPNNIDTVRCL